MMPDKPDDPKMVPVPQRTDEEIQSAADEQRRMLAMKSASNTWLTGGMGVKSRDVTTSAAKLLGGGM